MSYPGSNSWGLEQLGDVTLRNDLIGGKIENIRSAKQPNRLRSTHGPHGHSLSSLLQLLLLHPPAIFLHIPGLHPFFAKTRGLNHTHDLHRSRLLRARPFRTELTNAAIAHTFVSKLLHQDHQSMFPGAQSLQTALVDSV